MTQPTALFAEFVENWERYQSNVAHTVAPLTSEQLNLRAAPNLNSLGTIAAHIVAARAYWFHSVMGEGDDAFGKLRELDEQDTYNADEIVRGLQTTWHLMRECFARWTAEDLAAELFPRTWSGKQYMLSRQWVIWHILEHDLHHGGEVSLLLGMNGLQSPDV